MKLMINILLLGSISVLAAPLSSNHLDKRDLPTIWKALNAITADLTTLGNAITAFDGDTLKAVPVLDAATATMKGLTANQDAMKSTEELNLITSALVLIPVGSLYKAVDSVTSQLVAKKDLFDKADVLFVVADQLAQFKTVAADVVQTTLSKIPSYLSIISTPIGSSIQSLVDNAAKAYGV